MYKASWDFSTQTSAEREGAGTSRSRGLTKCSRYKVDFFRKSKCF